MILILIISSIVLFVILLFTSKTLSPIPYYPSNKEDLPLIIKILDLKNNQVVVDLGAGDGVVIFEAAKKAYQKGLNTRFIAVEINPILILIMYFRKLFHPNKKNIRIVSSDLFKLNLNKLTSQPANSLTFYLYLSPWFLDKIIKNLISSNIGKTSTVVSYMYSVKFLQKKPTVFKGKNNIYWYQIK